MEDSNVNQIFKNLTKNLRKAVEAEEKNYIRLINSLENILGELRYFYLFNLPKGYKKQLPPWYYHLRFYFEFLKKNLLITKTIDNAVVEQTDNLQIKNLDKTSNFLTEILSKNLIYAIFLFPISFYLIGKFNLIQAGIYKLAVFSIISFIITIFFWIATESSVNFILIFWYIFSISYLKYDSFENLSFFKKLLYEQISIIPADIFIALLYQRNATISIKYETIYEWLKGVRIDSAIQEFKRAEKGKGG
jgi:hypothetical protein